MTGLQYRNLPKSQHVALVWLLLVLNAMQNFKAYLLSMRITGPKAVDFYIHWVTQFFRFHRKQPADAVSKPEIEAYLKHLSKSRESWQVDQAAKAISLYQFHERRNATRSTRLRSARNDQWRSVVNDMRRMLRLMHRSYRTEKAYIGWVRRFYRFLCGKSPFSIDSSAVKDFMTYLAVEEKIAASTQNQAFNALLFLFRHILDKNLEDIADTIRAKRKERLPVVLTHSEIDQLFQAMQGTNLLMARIIYGCGLRLAECVSLRIKDIDFEREARYGACRKRRQGQRNRTSFEYQKRYEGPSMLCSHTLRAGSRKGRKRHHDTGGA